MEDDKENQENFKKTIKKKQEHVLGDITKNYSQTVEHGKQIGKESMSKINEVTSSTTDFLKSQEYLKKLKLNSRKFMEKGLEQKSMLKKSGPKFYKKITNGFFIFLSCL